MRKTLLAATAAIAVSAGSAAAQTTWDMPTPYADSIFHTANIIQFAEDVADVTGGELTINVHSAGSLYAHPDIFDAVLTQQVEIGEVLISLLANEDAIYGVDSVPFLATSYDDARVLWEVSRPYVEARLEAEGMMLLFAVPWPAQGLYTANAVEDMSAMSGVPFRAYNAATARIAELLGAVPTQVEVPEIPQAFATGIVEAMITSPSTGVSSSAWDFVDYYYDTQAWLPKNMVIVSIDAFEALPEAVQEGLLAAAAEAETRGWEMSQAEATEKTQILVDNGIQVSAPSETLSGQLAEIGATMAQEWIDNAGEDGAAIVDAFRAAQ